MMRFLPCYQVVESIRRGLGPVAACEDAIIRIRAFYPDFVGAIIAFDASGAVGAASTGWIFSYAVRTATDDRVRIVDVAPLPPVTAAQPGLY